MAEAKVPECEQDRLQALYAYDLLDRDSDAIFDTIIRIAADVCQTEISVIALIDRDRQYFFARNGMSPTETPRAIAFCAHAILEPGVTFEIPDATKDPRFVDNPLVTGEIGVRFYAAQPLTTPDGYAIGGLCLIGKTPKTLNDIQRNTLRGLADVIMTLFESRKAAATSAKFLVEAKHAAEGALAYAQGQKRQLHLQNDHFQAALNNMTQGLCMFDGAQRLIVCNRQYAEMHDLPAELLQPGTLLRKIVEHRIANGVYAGENPESYIQERFEWGQNPKNESTIHKLSDGRVISITRKPLADGGWVATHDDITARKQSEEALKTSEKHFRNLVEGSLQGVMIVKDWKLQFANQALANIFGYEDAEEVLALGEVGHIIAPEERRRIWGYKTARERDEFAPEVFESRGLRKDGSKIWVEYRVRKVDWRGSTAMQAVVLNIDNRKKAEAQNTRLARIVQDSINEVYVFGTGDLKFLQVNASACNNLGYTPAELALLTPFDLKPRISPPEFEEMIAPLKSGNVNHIRFQTVHRRKDGSDYDVDVVLQLIPSVEGPVFAAIIEDITERLKTERALVAHRDRLQELVDSATQELMANAEELKQALAKEKELNELQREFIAMTSHELRTPLAVIDGTAQRLTRQASKDQLSTDDTLQRAEKIRAAVARMTRLMESTLTAARLEKGQIAVAIQTCDIGQVIQDICARFQDITESHNITCQVRDLTATVKADPAALDQIITNLLNNAVKYSPSAQDVHVTVYGDGDQAVVQVEDYGLGIDEDDLPRMFSRFFRAKTSAGIVGTGIGLNLAKTLVEMHGGTISVSSKKGEGSSFTVRLPFGGPDHSSLADASAA